MEIWKKIQGYENLYEVSNLGNVRSLDHYREQKNNGKLCTVFYKGKILKPHKRGDYLSVHLSNGSDLKWESIHRLVAFAFCEKKSEKDIFVNHIDNNPKNNFYKNLEWTTPKGNMEHASKQGRMKCNYDNLKKAQEKKRKPIIVTKGDFSMTFNSQTEAAKTLKIPRSHISAACREEYGYKTVGGYKVRYADKEYQKKQKPKKVKMSDEARRNVQSQRMIGNKIMLGRHLTEQTKEKLFLANSKPVRQYTMDGVFVAEFKSQIDAQRQTGISHIYDCANGKRKSAGKYIWKWRENL